MKKLFFIVTFLLLVARPVLAVTPTTAEQNKIDEQISNLKDRVASRVAELKLVEKKAFTGVVSESSNTQITIKNIEGDNRIIEVDEITKFSSPNAKSQDNFGISDIKKGMNITALGLYNKESNKLLARYIDIITSPIFVFGKVSNIDKKEYTMTVTNIDNKEMIVDIENTTKTVVYDKNTFTRAGFSKVAVGDQVAVIGYPNDKGANRMQGGRIMLLNGLSSEIPSPSAKP